MDTPLLRLMKSGAFPIEPIKAGKEWPFILASTDVIEPQSLMNIILRRENLPEELPAIQLCLARGAVLNGNDMLRYKSRDLFKLWMDTAPGTMPIDALDQFMNNFEDWQLLMVAQNQPQHSKQVLRHAVNRGMFETVRVLVEQMGIRLPRVTANLLHPPNQIIRAYIHLNAIV